MALKHTCFCIIIEIYFLTFLSLSLQKTNDKKFGKYLFKYGYVDSLNPKPKTLKDGIKKFQEWHDLDVTGSMDENTFRQMEKPRCGMPDQAQDFASDTKWDKSRVTFKIVNWSEPFTKSTIRTFFEEAITHWTKGVNLKIVETASTSDIDVHFSTQDGSSQVLGYAYAPPNGDIFFDRDEDWTTNYNRASEKIYFGWVATHELGHALGLPHTDSRQSIMYPYYEPTIRRPSSSDVALLQRLYGRSTSALCAGHKIDAIVESDYNKKIVIDKEYWIVADGKEPKGPLSINNLFKDLPAKIDASFRFGTTTYVLSNDVFYKYKDDNKLLDKKLISIGFDNLPSNIDAAFFYPPTSSVYFFKGSKYFVLASMKNVGMRVVVNGEYISEDFYGVPDNIEAATYLTNSQVLLTKSSKCYLYDIDTKQLISSSDCPTTFYNC